MENYKKYIAHISNAKTRGIEFELTFDEWLGIWEKSGKFSQRGKKKGQYVMARFGDIGPYAVGNVKIILCSENIQEARATRIIATDYGIGNDGAKRLQAECRHHINETINRCFSTITNRAQRKLDRQSANRQPEKAAA